ncbi:hypothetical protein AVEN_233614-1 [Araneus ventricosus]|uniref:Reverse transcriptase domain-containing protein n=1 Tax=Araneus ventricosus TaxID=182803 RepID=A0A4Y2SJE0_ARAVE|nr:hypothetical protein AVEN_233614-1 [Araneus ventricosus]
MPRSDWVKCGQRHSASLRFDRRLALLLLKVLIQPEIKQEEIKKRLNSAESVCSNLLVEEKLPRTLESFWNIELEVNSPDELLEAEEALRLFENSIEQKNDRYVVRLPWINENVTLHDNYPNAERRFFDIQKAFLKISVSCEDRDAMRFLWIHDDSNLSNPKVQIYRMCRVMFGAKSSPFLLSDCMEHHLRKFEGEYPKTVELLNSYMYVDDFICGTNTEMEAIEAYHNANTIIKKAKMTLTKWNSNSLVLRKEYEADKYEDSRPLCDSSSKVLGLEWDNHNYVFSFSAQDIIECIQKNEQTKRCVLQAVSRIFDPIGFLATYVIQAKVLFQDLRLTGIDWDKPIPVQSQSK